MKKQIRFHIGDKVRWNGCSGELSIARHGTIVKIKQGIAYIYCSYHNTTKEMPIKKLQFSDNV